MTNIIMKAIISRYGFMTRILCAAAVVAACASASYSAFEENTASARSRAMADTYSPLLPEPGSVFLQSAGLSGIKDPRLSITYGRLFYGLSDRSSISDGIFTFALPVSGSAVAGAGYKSIRLDGAYSEESGVVAGAISPLNYLSVGGAVKYLSIKYGSDAYTRIDPVFAAAQSKSAFDLDAGILVKLPYSMNLSYTRHNIFGADLGIKEAYKLEPGDYAGVSYAEQGFSFAVEAGMVNKKSSFSAGTEKILLNNMLAVRFGLFLKDARFNKLTAGLGLNVERFSLDYGIDFPVNGVEKTNGTHYITLTTRFSGLLKTGKAETKSAAVPKESEVLQPVEKPAEPDIKPLSYPVLPGMLDNSGLVAVSSSAARSDYDVRPSSAAEVVLSSSTAGNGKAVLSAGTTAVPLLRAAPDKIAEQPAPAQKVSVPGRIYIQQGLKTHKVLDGETLPLLAEKYYGNKSEWLKIYDANKDKIEKGSLKPGQTIVIP
ncbi:MAG: hypothetical protein A2339_07965 [Elusimicrobia bacterium RIFOXYB12_FULL_50_12]|nr:MAG: hypothetical protein A2278_02760 [Elusimicrobia bacterium RIFOXYA12_FULL_49_49]OGS16402.1 MAG: hypothetical protein A2251_06215 [Elusimicrobia bacterium RIFOXYA2_FULL_47_53]OGS27221.1 MAG: hypothetical protein A2339_07965 [Elusimicrobia bacterium RIFOXYB12_FULL_50_12]OGS30421.1 MAG: hypothetical protein A2323_02825 [Elusimicrobia bacterium RIFOXYB2_FULL_46_23]